MPETLTTVTETTAVVDVNNNGDAAAVKIIDEDDDSNLMDEWKTLTEENMIRGKTPVDIQERCLRLCRDYVAGLWLKAQSTDDIEVTRISGGLTNQLYKVRLSKDIVDGHEEIDDMPHAVAIKLFEPKHYMFSDQKEYNALERLSDTIVLTLVSQLGLSPRVYGIFPEGFIQRFYEHEQFRREHQQQPELWREMARILAVFHNLKVPIAKERNHCLEGTRVKLDDAYARYDIEGIARANNFKELLENDPREEFKRLEKIVEAIDAPMVLCHNDFRGSNMLVTKPNNRLFTVDMEYARYGPRAWDICTILFEWDRDLFDFVIDKIPDDEVIETFVRYYVEEMDKIDPGYAQRPSNEIKQVVKETKTYMLLMFLFFISFFMEQKGSIIEAIQSDKVKELKTANIFYKNYFKIKQELINDGTIQI